MFSYAILLALFTLTKQIQVVFYLMCSLLRPVNFTMMFLISV